MFIVVSTLACPMICATTLAGTPLSCAHDEYVRLNVNHVTRGRSAASHAGQTHRVKTLFGEIGLPDTVEKISSWAAVRFVRAFHPASNRSAASGKGMGLDLKPYRLLDSHRLKCHG